ncbi:PREDICTED: protein FAM90A27P-like [Colobus angolensis palliatus]|uniref:protein FAM90A27P-like n=1 Tax=Colobus angolensis palliatus TaxID=336983 RepID=UPI0005F42486|nr:PREDICTED: protein FAM90A27P-like [Colobus angolensis palliatus]
MDPNTLSMEQGKQFLKQCGIPQRDIDLMTEKWVVLASVEVLLRFPLKPGEDLTARCVSNVKCQALVDRPPTISQRRGSQEGRKSNNQLRKRTDQKLKDLPQMAGHPVHHLAQRLPTAKNPQKQQRRPMGQRTPPAEEEESRVKFGNSTAELSHVRCFLLQHPTMPLPVHSTKKRSVLGPVSTGPPPVYTPGMRLLCPSRHNDRAELSTCGPTKGHGGDTAASLLRVVKSSHQNPTLSARPPANRPDVSSHGAPQPAVKASVLGPGLKSQAEIKPPDADAKPGPQQVRRKCGQDSRTQTPGKQPVPVPIQTVQNPTKKARLSSFQTPTLRTQFPDVGTVRTLQPPFMATGLGSKQAPKATTETAATKTATLQPRVSLQLPGITWYSRLERNFCIRETVCTGNWVAGLEEVALTSYKSAGDILGTQSSLLK